MILVTFQNINRHTETPITHFKFAQTLVEAAQYKDKSKVRFFNTEEIPTHKVLAALADHNQQLQIERERKEREKEIETLKELAQKYPNTLKELLS